MLQIEIKSTRDFGTYECVAKNEIGEEHVSFTLEQGDKPPPVGIFKLVSIGSEDVGLEMHLSNDSTVQLREGMEPNGFFVEYRESNSSGEWNRTEFDLNKGRDGSLSVGS